MIPYYLLYIVLIFVDLLKINKITDKWILYFTPIFLLLALRHPSMGIDLGYFRSYGYLHSFDYISKLSYINVLRIGSFSNYEFGYVLFNKFVSMIYPSRQLFLAICAFLSLYPFARLFKRYSNNSLLSFIIFKSVFAQC